MRMKTAALHALMALTLFMGISEGASRRRDEQKVQEELDKARQELRLYQIQLEEVRVKRWQDKRNAVAAQEAFSEAWNELKTDIERLSQAKDQKEETLLRLQNQESEKRKEVEEQDARLKQFGLQIREKLAELDGEWERGFPYRSTEKLARMSVFKKSLGKGAPAGSSALDGLFALAEEDFRDGESRGLTREKLALRGVSIAAGSAQGTSESDGTSRLGRDAQAKIAAGYMLRLGQAYQAFVSTEGEDVAILGKTGRLDGKTWDWIEDVNPQVRRRLREAVLGLVRAPSGGVPDSLAGSAPTGPMLLPVDVMLTKATGEGFTTKAGGGFREALEREFAGGGWVMWPILGLALAGIFIVGEKVIVFIRKDQAVDKLAGRVQVLAGAGRIPEAIDLCRKSGGSVGRVLLAILEQADGSREDAESRAHEVMLDESPALEKRITTMNILAAASPLVGLLGTVTGMVRLFDVITVHGTGNPKLMAGGISEALIATKWGLGVAIPLLLSYNWLDTWSVRIIGNMEKHAARLVNTLFPAVKRVEEHV